jgi:hypothetical protein
MYRRSPLDYQDLETGLLELGLLTFVGEPEIALTAPQDPAPRRPKRRAKLLLPSRRSRLASWLRWEAPFSSMRWVGLKSRARPPTTMSRSIGLRPI